MRQFDFSCHDWVQLSTVKRRVTFIRNICARIQELQLTLLANGYHKWHRTFWQQAAPLRHNKI